MQTVTTGAPSLVELAMRYDTDEKCRELLESLRWPDGPRCPKCDSSRAYDIHGRKVYQCGDCDFQYSATTGTVMHSTKLPLVKWILAAALLTNARKGLSSCQLARDLRIQQKSAWYLAMRLRRAMRENEWLRKFNGIVELDESYLGGRERGGKRGRGTANKRVVFGMKERDGRAAMKVIPDASYENIRKVVVNHVQGDARLMADQWRSYNQLAEFALERIDHGLQYTDGQIHTQGIESLWAILKRQYHGTHHHMTTGYLPLYLDEITYRFNHRMNPKLFSMVLENGLLTDRMVLNRRPAKEGEECEPEFGG